MNSRMVESFCWLPARRLATVALMQPMVSVSLMLVVFISQALVGSFVRWAGFGFWAVSRACTRASDIGDALVLEGKTLRTMSGAQPRYGELIKQSESNIQA